MTAVQRAFTAALIAGKGQTATITYSDGGTYNTATGTISGVTDYTITTKAVVLPKAARAKDGGAIVAGDETLLIAAIDTDGDPFTIPPVNAVVTLADSSKRVIVAIEALTPAGLVILYDATVRLHQ